MKYFLFWQVNFKIYHKPIGKQNESTKVVEMNTNLCSYFKKPKRGDIFTGYFKSLVQKYGKIPSCPIKPVSVKALKGVI